MIKLDLLKKEDIVLLLEGFETSFLQVPMKYVPKEVLKFVPNGFRVEKLGRAQLLKVYTESLLAGEVTITSYIEREIQMNFENVGIEKYMSDMLGKEYSTSAVIAEISGVIFESGLVIPAHIVLMLYGIECSPEEKGISEKLHRVFNEQKKQANQDGFDAGYSKGEAKFASELEAEQKKNAKLQKNLDALNNKGKNDNKSAKQSEKENKGLAAENAELSKKIKELEKLIQEQEDDLYALYEEGKRLQKVNDNLSQELSRVLAEMQTIKKCVAEAIAEKENAVAEKEKAVAEAIEKQKQAQPIPQNEIRAACVEAVNLFSSKSAGRNAVLTSVRNQLAEGEDVKTTWEKLNAATFSIIDQVNTALLDNTFELQMLDKFSEIETLLLLESAIQRALRVLAYRAMASATINDDAEDVFFEQE